jgi:hypothetical protein
MGTDRDKCFCDSCRAERKAELLAKLAACAENGDTEAAHIDADAALLDYIADDDVRAAFEQLEKWYA